MNAGTNQIEIDLVEEVYLDKENTDQLLQLRSTANAPYVISVAVCSDQGTGEGDVVVLDCDSIEIQCVDQILHLAIDKDLRVHAI